MDPRAAVNIYRRERSRVGRPAFQFLEWRSHLAPQIILPRSRESFQSGGIYRRNSGVHDRRSTFLQPLSIWPSFTRSLHVLRTTLALPPLSAAGRASASFLPSGLPGWGRRATNSELPSAEYLGSIFVFLGSKRAFGSDRRRWRGRFSMPI